MALPLFTSSLQDALAKLARREYASEEERNALLKTVFDSQNLKPKDAVWMAFRSEQFLRDASVRILRRLRTTETVGVFVAESRDKNEASLRVATEILFGLRIPKIEDYLMQLLNVEDDAVREATRRLVMGAPASKPLEALFWKLVETGQPDDRAIFLERLATLEVNTSALMRWNDLAADNQPQVRAVALKFLADNCPQAAIDQIVDNLPRVDYATQQHLIDALAKVAKQVGPEFVDRLLPLMASGEAGTRSAVLKVLLTFDDRHDLVKRYLKFSKDLAGWARDRALDSMREFGDDLVEPTIELLADPDDEVRALALVVAGSFEDPRVIPATIELLKDGDWWMRVTAAETLGRFDDPRTVDALVTTLADDEARWAAVEALGRIGDPRSLPALAKLLNDPAAEIRIEVLLALRKFNHPKIIEALQRVAATDPDRVVRARALELAEEVAKRDDAEVEDAEGLRRKALRMQTGEGEPQLHSLLVETRNRGASDLHLSVGLEPLIRTSGVLDKLEGRAYGKTETEAMLTEILTDDQLQELKERQQLDLCYFVKDAGRYRSNIFVDHKGMNGVFRVIPEQPPTIEEIGLPGHLADIASHHQGLVLVCGPSGCGKTTTLAALVNLFNETRQSHIITLEEPVEFVHPFKNCLINQREIGNDTESYARALRGALREDPDVIVIGDLRDNESISLALTAAETGHIVLGTLSSTTAPKAIDRIITSFPHKEQAQVRIAVAESLKYIIAQRLLPVEGSFERVACFEVLIGTTSVANLIRDEKTYQLPSAMQMGKGIGMQAFDDGLRGLLRQRKISGETAYLHASNREEFEGLVSEEFLETGI
jgi:twitching motility protein PilT